MTDYRYVFFPCSDYETLDDETKRIIEQDEKVLEEIQRYEGICADGLTRNLNPENIEEKFGVFSLINPNNTFTPEKWQSLKSAKKIARNTEQTESLLTDLKLLPITNIRRLETKRQEVWDGTSVRKLNSCEYMGCIIDYTEKKLVGVAKAEIHIPGEFFPKNTTYFLPLHKNFVYITEVDIHPKYRGRHLCKIFLKWFMSKFPKYSYFRIVNGSITGSGIPACMCYVKAGIESGYKMYYLVDSTNTFQEMTSEECIYSENNPLKLPREYFYIKKMTGSGKINKKNNKKTNKKTNRKRKHKSRKNKKNKEKKIFSMKLNTYPRAR
jgi:hypothetical protein